MQNLSQLFSLSFISQQSLGNNSINMLAYANAIFSRFCEPTRNQSEPATNPPETHQGPVKSLQEPNRN